MANSVRDLDGVSKGGVEADILLLKLLLQLCCDEYHVNSSTALLEVTLTLAAKLTQGVVSDSSVGS